MPVSKLVAEVLNPGLLRHQITWQRKGITGQSSFGTDEYTWNVVLVCKARVLSLGGTEQDADMEKMAVDMYQITQHYYKGLRPGDRIEWWNDDIVTYFDVLNISDTQGLERFQVVLCKALEGRTAE